MNKSRCIGNSKLTDSQWLRRWRRALWGAYLLQYIPYVRYVGLNGSMARLKAHQESDIDLFIATTPGHIFFSRLLTRFFVLVVGLGRTRTVVANRLCLNRYGTTKSLEISPHDSYHASVFSSQIPLYDAGMYHEAYIAANHWWRQFGHTGIHRPACFRPGIPRIFQAFFEIVLRPFSGILERLAASWQQSRSLTHIHRKGSLIQMSEKSLCFVERSWDTE